MTLDFSSSIFLASYLSRYSYFTISISFTTTSSSSSSSTSAPPSKAYDLLKMLMAWPESILAAPLAT
eukprot:CAMPEP_0168611808 /NCGR_PEP_ID=MMETSP0449_2-20121227/2561_1 /TAXON_ID=1082188 /ORGANISM="Strombidium rassoulzadegani, Strain ras09" /LENGTH=66 /DNA_ID=CAMNT_0008652291 /DNA_START=433 /DNA_END=633 /DNA_ORIENTATION=-